MVAPRIFHVPTGAGSVLDPGVIGKNADEVSWCEDLSKMFVCIDENFARGERWIFPELSLGEFFNFKGQNVGHFESFAGLKVLPIFPGLSFWMKASAE